MSERIDELYELATKYLELAHGENPYVIVSACFSVINHICDDLPEMCVPTAEFMCNAAELLKERRTYEHTH